MTKLTFKLFETKFAYHITMVWPDGKESHFHRYPKGEISKEEIIEYIKRLNKRQEIKRR